MDSVRIRSWRLLPALALAACQSYEPKPLEPEAILVSVDQARRAPDGGTPAADRPAFTFARAADLLARHGPALKEARAEYETALALARIPTPFPNPTLEAGPSYGFGPDVTGHALQPFGSLGFTIPLGGRLGDQDEVNRLNAEVARVEFQARHREAYLDLRRQYAAWAIAHERLRIREELAESAERSLELGRRLLEGGRLSAMDLGLLELETARIRTGSLDVQGAIEDIAGDLSLTVGIHADGFLPLPAPALPDVPREAPDLAALRGRLTDNHAELGRLRARYEMAERELRLEIAKQYPDLTIGPSFEKEVGEQKTVLGLAIGIELPIFDRNQQGIALASQRREEVRARYEAAANRALAALERADRKVRVAAAKRDRVRDGLLPKAQAQLELARKALQAGATDTLRLLEAVRGQRAALLEALDAEMELWTAWVELERAVGCPLVRFPGDGASDAPELTPVAGDAASPDQE
jgi:outer membrane protein TolC